MAFSIALIIILGLIGNLIFTKLKLPGLLGMLIIGVIIGPYSLNLLDNSILNVSSDLRKIALIIILLRAGLGLNRNELKKVGKTTFFMSFLPGVLEGLTVAVISIWLLKLDFIRGGMLGFILAAVSPAVVVPLMLKFIEEKRGKRKGIPVLILSAATIDDVFAITIFASFMGMYVNKNFNVFTQLINIPIAIILGICLGLMVGIIVIMIFNKYSIRDSKKVLLLLSLAIIMTTLENFITIASLLGVMALGFIITERIPELGKRLSIRFNKIWLFAELFLFVLVGSEVNLKVAISAGLIGILVIFIGLIVRSIGVLLATMKSDFNYQEKLFLIVSYLPKATVQAAIGGIPLAEGVPNGDLILAVAVLSIIITAPLGAIGINFLAPKLLHVEE